MTHAEVKSLAADATARLRADEPVKLSPLETVASRLNVHAGSLKIRLEGRSIYIDSKDQFGKAKNVGELSFIAYDEGKALSVTGIYSYPPQIGVGKALYEQLLLRYPNCQKIETLHLAFANKQELDSILAKGHSLVDAIKQTPSYKLGAQFGFTEVEPILVDDNFSFWSMKPPQAWGGIKR